MFLTPCKTIKQKTEYGICEEKGEEFINKVISKIQLASKGFQRMPNKDYDVNSLRTESKRIKLLNQIHTKVIMAFFSEQSQNIIGQNDQIEYYRI